MGDFSKLQPGLRRPASAVRKPFRTPLGRGVRTLVGLFLGAVAASFVSPLPAATSFRCEGSSVDTISRRCRCEPPLVEHTDGQGVSQCLTRTKAKVASNPPPASSIRILGDGPSCPKGMASIPGGSFRMGKRGDDVTVQRFCLDETEVTVQAYAKCVSGGHCTEPQAYRPPPGWSSFCNWKNPEGRRVHPVNCVTWYQAGAYCAAAGARLPTEEEFEWAAQSGRGWNFPWGAARLDGTRVNACGTECSAAVEAATGEAREAVYPMSDGFVSTAPVGSFPRGDNVWGVHDLLGNVAEWLANEYAPGWSERVIGGGSWDTQAAAWLSADTRSCARPQAQGSTMGFRCARGP
jgi:formylglycine-generating enzyme